MDNELQLNLGEYECSPGPCPGGGWKANVGIFAGVWTPFRKEVRNLAPSILEPFGTFKAFDKCTPAIVNQVYKLKLEWNAEKQDYRVWIDDVLQRVDGSPDIPLLHPARKGLDTLMIHPGNRNPNIGPTLYSCWGNIRITTKGTKRSEQLSR